MLEMPLSAWITLAAVIAMAVALMRQWAATDVIVLGTVVLLLTAGTLLQWAHRGDAAEGLPGAALPGAEQVEQTDADTALDQADGQERTRSDVLPGAALPGAEQVVRLLGNPGLITIAALFVVAAGLTHSGAMAWLAQTWLGQPRTLGQARRRLITPVAAMSAVMNNTPIVAMLIPALRTWAQRRNLSPSALLMPLSFAAILGGMCTLIGTSTNLIVHGLAIAHGFAPMGLFQITALGLPCCVVGLVYIVFAAKHLLPKAAAADAMPNEADLRQYAVQMIVEPRSPLVGKTIAQAGLRHLPGLYLAEIEREGQLMPAVGPDQVLRARDRLSFVGKLDSVVDLRQMRGLSPATDQVNKLSNSPSGARCLVEAVVSDRCPLVGRSIRAGRFRSVYNAAVLAVSRRGHRLSGKIGDIVLEPGDTLLLEAHQAFANRFRDRRDFFLVSSVPESTPTRHHKAPHAIGVMVAMVVLVTLGVLSLLHGALLAAGAMVLLRCCTTQQARASVDWSLLLIIAGAMGVGMFIDQSGLAGAVVHDVLALAGHHPWLVLAIIYLATNVLTELITNAAAAAVVFPIALTAADRMDAEPMAFVMVIMIAASASFMTPLGYQTNLMVQGPGRYRYVDFLRFGAPLTLLVMITAVTLAPLIWPL